MIAGAGRVPVSEKSLGLQRTANTSALDCFVEQDIDPVDTLPGQSTELCSAFRNRVSNTTDGREKGCGPRTATNLDIDKPRGATSSVSVIVTVSFEKLPIGKFGGKLVAPKMIVSSPSMTLSSMVVIEIEELMVETTLGPDPDGVPAPGGKVTT